MITASRLRWPHYVFLAIFACLILLPGRATLPPMDRDESRYLQATTQMLETHDWVDVRFQNQPRYLQPAGIYWLEAASVSLFSSPAAKQVWAYRIPSLIGAVLAVLFTARMGAMLFGVETGLAAGMLLACSVLLGVEGRIATIDATLLAFVTFAQAALLRLYLDREADRPSPWRHALVFWAALGCGLMLKGPVILLPCWGTLIGLAIAERRVDWWRRLHPAWGLPLMAAIVLPWCAAIWHVSHGTFFTRSVGHNFLGKVANGQEAHGLPPGYHLLAFSLAFWPGSLFAVAAIPFAWAWRRTPPLRFLLAWIIPTWLVFELIATKLPHYVLPTYPAIAILAAAALFAPMPVRYRWRWVLPAYAAIWLLVSAALAGAGLAALWFTTHRLAPLPLLLAPLILAAAIATLRYALIRQPRHAMICLALTALITVADLYGAVLPQLRPFFLSPQIAQLVAAHRPCADSVLASSAYSEPSLVFLAGEHTLLVPADQAADDLIAHPRCDLALIGARDRAVFLARLAQAHRTAQSLGGVDGINLSNGRHLALTLYTLSTASE